MSDISHLEWRAAVKHYDTSKKLTDDQLETLSQALNLAPSAYGIQPYHFVLVTNDETLEKLGEAGYNQPQFTESTGVFVLASRIETTEADIDAYLENIAETRGVSLESLDGLAGAMKGMIQRMSPEENEQWAARQVYIPVGFLTATAAQLKIDASPMEGFDSEQVDSILGLREKGYTSRAIVAVGYRSDEDTYSKMKKVRRPLDQILTKIA